MKRLFEKIWVNKGKAEAASGVSVTKARQWDQVEGEVELLTSKRRKEGRKEERKKGSSSGLEVNHTHRTKAPGVSFILIIP